ncbi:MAG TPA: flagellar basal body rod protein FlgC [Bacteroidetes bacterium]|nr:flagellar basal-body rod protein FlgC [bacterium BMS3Bbin04]HDO64933.1 flagellar basal body rod protein FlgC [Bacteroidota bacterium]HEX04058.1 flagellar basal body rod protein FlgC [Bacteroidota bacterium]
MEIRGIFSSIDISATGLSANRRRMDAIAENIANVNTTRTDEGGPYRRRISVFREDVRDAQIYRAREETEGGLALETTRNDHIHSSHTRVQARDFSGVQQLELRDNSTPDYYYDPSHPDANEFGYVARPKINIITEMTDMIAATRNYEANVSAIDAAKSIAKRALEI